MIFTRVKDRPTIYDRKFNATWSSNPEQDAKALFDLNIQSELINSIGQQIALDIDKGIIDDITNDYYKSIGKNIS